MSEQSNQKANGFYTLKGYSLINSDALTSAMEDYLEMIFRLHNNNETVRIKNLSQKLHVKPPSASKMANILKREGLINFEKYGHITLTEKGGKQAAYLMFRHNILHSLLCFINNSQDELAQVEKIEHFINKETVYNIKNWLDKMSLS